VLPCMLGALKGVRLPRVRRDENVDALVCDSRRKYFTRLGVNPSNPAVLAFGVFEPALHKGLMSGPSVNQEKKYILADVDSLEGDLCSEEIMVVVEGDGKGTRFRKVVKMGGSAVTAEDMKNVFILAEERWKVWNDLLNNLDTDPN
jgi:hypothetical protein